MEEQKTYKDEKGNIEIPADAIIACMRNAVSEVGEKIS